MPYKNRPKHFNRWTQIKQRCYNPNHSRYEGYGGRGITMYEPWINDYKLFESYIDSLPHPPNTTLDRVNNDFGYHPMNLRWATPKQQLNNTRIQQRVSPDREHNIKTYGPVEAARMEGVTYHSIYIWSKLHM